MRATFNLTSTPANRRVSLIPSVVVALLVIPFFLCAETWRTFDGIEIEANPISFDFETKTVVLENPETGAQTNYNSRDLDFHSRRKLLTSKVFHNSYQGWSKEKITLLALAIFSPVILLIVGMWLAGLFIAKHFNPFKAVGAFLGSWVAGVLLVVCYLIFASKADIGNSILIIGVVIATVVMALFTSSVYRTTFIRGLLIFACHVVFAALIGYVLIFGADILLPHDEVNAFWDKWIFGPVGLVNGTPDGY